MSTGLVLAEMWMQGELQRRGHGVRAAGSRRGFRSWWRARRDSPAG
jgi:hypothetical protein